MLMPLLTILQVPEKSRDIHEAREALSVVYNSDSSHLLLVLSNICYVSDSYIVAFLSEWYALIYMMLNTKNSSASHEDNQSVM